MPPSSSHVAPALLEVMKRNPVTVAPETALDQVLELLERYGFRHLPVVEANRVVGMISDRDVYLATGLLGTEQRLRDERGRELPGARLAGEIQRRPVHCLTQEATVLEAARDMLRLRIGAIPVVERGGGDVLCGIVTETDLLRIALELCRSDESADAPARARLRSPLPCVAPETSIEEALQRLDPEIRHLGVLHGSSLVGIVSERDLLFGLARTAIREARATAEPRNPEPPRRVEQIMSTRLVTAAPETPLSHCAGRMLDRRISALPVLEGEKPLGIVTRRDVLAHLVDACGEASAPERRERP